MTRQSDIGVVHTTLQMSKIIISNVQKSLNNSDIWHVSGVLDVCLC